MPILGVDDAAGTFRHRCALCGYEDDLFLDPAKEQVTVGADGGSLITRACPHCAAHGVDSAGKPLTTVECFRLNIPSWEAGEAPHPGSLAGTRLPGPRRVSQRHGTAETLVNVVSEHVEGYHLIPERVAQARFLRAMQQHPHLAPHAPLRSDPPHLPGHPPQAPQTVSATPPPLSSSPPSSPSPPSAAAASQT